jgi:hypothetical protein
LQLELKTRKNMKDILSKQLIDVMKQNEIDTFDINNGTIEYKHKVAKKPLSKKIILNTLNTFFEGDEDKIKGLHALMNDNREIYTKDNIVRKIDK